jgi:hypothetical protein
MTFKISFLLGVLKVSDENSRIRIHLSEAWIRGFGSVSRYQNITDPQHWLFL